jgi:predicted DCC family thiol-disulfide oxidoreductase YuxK
MPSSSDQTRVGRTLTLGEGAESSLEGRDIELSVSPKDIRTSLYVLYANRSDRRQPREGDRWFESTSLQRRVRSELLPIKGLGESLDAGRPGGQDRVRFVIERDASARFRFVTIQSTRGSTVATRLAVDVASPETNVAIINGYAYFKSDAMILVLAGLPGWSWSRIFLLLPRRVRDWAYDRIARNRYRLFGRNESCLVPTSAIAARFVLDDPSGEQP